MSATGGPVMPDSINITSPLTTTGPSTIREQVLQEAESLVMGDRNKAYAGPKENFAQTADLWSAYLNMRVSPHDVGVLMILLKVARLTTSPGKMDNWIDIAGYAACGAETV